MPRRSDAHYAEAYVNGEQILMTVQKLKQLQHKYSKQQSVDSGPARASAAIALNFIKRFRSWLTKCYNRESAQWKYYGALNIGVHEAWLEDPQLFIDWVLDKQIPHHLLGEVKTSRQDFKKGFSPDNLVIHLPEDF